MKGLFDKFTVIKNETNEKMQEATFTLVPERDPAAVEALKTYAKHTPNEELASDINAWLETLKK